VTMEARLASETDLAGFREESRLLLRQQVPPEAVHWETPLTPSSDFFADLSPNDHHSRDMPKAASAIVPPSFLRLCEVVVLHHDPDRFALLYRLLWRLVHEPGLRNDPIDADMLHAHQMAQSVRREIHKMKSLLRFRTVADAGGALQLAWFEPAHHILAAVAPWFAKRVPQSRWAIMTPERSVEWDGERLHYAAGLARSQVPSAGQGDAAWLACYRAVFGPQAAVANVTAAS
jgi:probable DNA metabolism protein